VLHHHDILTEPRAPKEMIETKVASCKGQAPAPTAIPSDGIIEKRLAMQLTNRCAILMPFSPMARVQSKSNYGMAR